MDRQPWTQWEKKGSLSMLDRIQARIRKILEMHTPYPLPDGALEKINAILEFGSFTSGNDSVHE
jgi:trimethylamine:corrinoid methyltransferase-like protein